MYFLLFVKDYCTNMEIFRSNDNGNPRAGFVSQRVEDNKDRYDGSSSYSGLLCSIGSVLDGIASIRVDHPSPVHLHAWT